MSRSMYVPSHQIQSSAEQGRDGSVEILRGSRAQYTCTSLPGRVLRRKFVAVENAAP